MFWSQRYNILTTRAVTFVTDAVFLFYHLINPVRRGFTESMELAAGDIQVGGDFTQ